MTVDRSPARPDYEFVIGVKLPPGMTPEAFLAGTSIEWNPGQTNGGMVFRTGRDLAEVPEFVGEKELRRA